MLPNLEEVSPTFSFKFKNILNNIFTGSPRPFGNDTTGNGMLYNYMPHATGTPGDFYGRTQTGKTGHKKKNKNHKIVHLCLKTKNCLSFHFFGTFRKKKLNLLETQTFLP